MVLAWPVAAEWRPVDVLVVRDAVRDYRLRRKIESLEIDELRHLAQEGIGSRPDLEANVVFARLRARFGRPSSVTPPRGLLLSPRAAIDLEEIAEYTARDNPVRAASLVAELEATWRAVPKRHPILLNQKAISTSV